MKKALSFILLSVFMLISCGQSGPLYLPDSAPYKNQKRFYE